jgi:hypothetical protein
MKKRKFGIRMDGCEVPLEELIKKHIPLIKKDVYTLIEIGSAGCTTLRAFSDILNENTLKWRAIGFDLPPESAWSLDMNEINTAFDNNPKIIREDNKLHDNVANCMGMNLVLLNDPRSYFKNGFPFQVDFALIDGCHGACSGKDFEAIENIVSIGGLVVFHDYGVEETGTDWQHHCEEFINVRTYVHRLGLAEPCNKKREGWRPVGEIPGSRKSGGDGNSCFVTQKISPPKNKPSASEVVNKFCKDLFN